MEDDKVVIIAATPEHVDDVAKLHQQEIPSLLSLLTLPLISLYYLNSCFDDRLFFRVLIDDGKVAGFYLASADANFSHVRLLLRRPWSFVRRLLRFEDSLVLLARILVTRGQVPDVMPKAKLLYLAVKRHYRGKGVGKVLLVDLFRMMRTHSVTSVGVHIEEGNEDAIGFYKAMGGKVLSEFRSAGRKINIMSFDTTVADHAETDHNSR